MDTNNDVINANIECIDEQSNDLESYVQQLSNEYVTYLQIDPINQKKQTEDSIEELLTHLEEFCGLLEMIRIDNTVCLEQTLQKVRQNAVLMEEVYEQIDRLEQFVEVVKRCVSDVEDDMDKAQQLFPKNRVKKFFTSIINNSTAKQTLSSPRNFRYDAPYIFKTSDYIFKDNELTSDENNSDK